MDPTFQNMRVIAYSADDWNLACPTIRITGPLNHAGIAVVQGTEWRDGKLEINYSDIPQCDLVIIARDFPIYKRETQKIIQLAKENQKKIIYECDDLLTELPTFHPDFVRYSNLRQPFLDLLPCIDAITTSTKPLLDFYRQYHSNVFLLENYLDDQIWRLNRESLNFSQSNFEDPIVIGYYGTNSHKPDIEAVLSSLIKIVVRFGEKIAIKFWGVSPPEKLLGYSNVFWIHEGNKNYREFAELYQKLKIDIAIAPLSALNQFNQYKSAIKYFELSSMGIPGIFSRCYPYENVIDHPYDGFLASSEEDWDEYLALMIEDKGLREQMGLRVREKVIKTNLLSDNAYRWRDTYQLILNRHNLGEAASKEKELADVRRWNNEYIPILEANKEEIDKTIPRLKGSINYLEKEILRLQTELDGIHNSTGWKFLEFIYKIRLKLIPHHSKREAFLQSILRHF